MPLISFIYCRLEVSYRQNLRQKKERLDQTIVNIWGIFNQLKFQTRKWHYSDSIHRIKEISEMPSELQID